VSTSPLLEVSDLRVRLRSAEGSVDGVSYSVDPGQTLAIVGESGSGAATALLTTLGLTAGSGATITGRIAFQGEDLLTLGSERLRRIRGNEIALIPRDPLGSLHPSRSLGDQLGEVAQVHLGVGAAAARDRAVDLLELVGIPDPHHAVDRSAQQLSAGMCQRALIAMALVADPKLLIAQEPTAMLDLTVQAQILALLGDLQRRSGLALIITTQDLGVAAEIADNVCVMSAGRIVERAPTAQLCSAPQHAYTRHLLTDVPRLDRPPARAERPSAPTSPLLEVDDLIKRFGRGRGTVTAVDHSSFRVAPGETLGIVGERGCGMSSLARLLVRLIDPSSGEIRFAGESITTIEGAALKGLRRKLQTVVLDPAALNPGRTVGASIAEPLEIYQLFEDSAGRAGRVHQLMDRLGLNRDHSDRYPHDFSPGERVRIALARAMALEPALLVVEDRAGVLDVSPRTEVLKALGNLRAELGLTLVFLSHDLAAVRELCNRVAVMYLGTIVELARVDWLYGYPRHPYSGALLSAATVPDPAAGRRRRRLLASEAPGRGAVPSGCGFHPRCPKVQAICATERPLLSDVQNGTLAACHFPLTREELGG
jgi:peptide/nickel transport system ATP-binding protein